MITDVPFIEFQEDDPAPEEWEEYYVSPLNDEPFAPFFGSMPWKPGRTAA